MLLRYYSICPQIFIGARWCGGTPRHRARGNAKGRGCACAAPLDGRGSWAVIQGVGLVGPAIAVPPASFANRFTGSTSGDAKPSPCPSCRSAVHLDPEMLLPLDAFTFPGPSGTARREPRTDASKCIPKGTPRKPSQKSRFAVDPTCRFLPLDKQLFWCAGISINRA